MRQVADGEPMFLMGSPGTSMMAVLSGRVRISIPSNEGREIVLAVLQPGEVFGEIAVLDGKDRTADAHAVTACTLAVLERHDVLEFLERSPMRGPGWSKCFVIDCVRPIGRWLKSPWSNCRCDLRRRCSG